MTTIEQGSKNTKWIWIGLGAAALFCLCAVAVAFFTFYKMGQQVREGVKTDPESVSKAAHEIADYDLPDGYEERMAMDIMIYSFVVIGPQSYVTDEPLIMLAQFQTGMDQQQVEQQLRQSAEQQFGFRGMKMQLVEVKEATIRGEQTEINIYEGTDQNGMSMRQLITAFPGKDGNAMLLILGEVNGWDQELVDDFIKSIR